MNGNADDDRRGKSEKQKHSDARDLAPTESSRLTRPPASLPPHRLEALLQLAEQLRADGGTAHLAREFVRAMARQLPGLGLAVVVPGASVMEGVLPSGAALGRDADPAEPFPDLEQRRSIQLDSGATLRVASSGPLQDEEERLLTRSAEILRSFLEQARAFEAPERESRDLTELRAQVIQAEKLASLGQLAAGIMHELNNPLTSIVAYADHLRQRAVALPVGAEDAERIKRIGEAAERVLEISRDLVSYARPAPQVPAPVRLADVVEKALVFCEHEFAENGVTVARELSDHTPLVRGLPGPLTQVFVNLFTNAAHAMSEKGGKLTVRSSLADDAVVVEVSDQGTGMTAEQLARIFEPFYTTKARGRGSGLGLCIVRSIIDAHGGRLEPRSVRGAGTTFVLTLPLSANPSLSPPR